MATGSIGRSVRAPVYRPKYYAYYSTDNGTTLIPIQNIIEVECTPQSSTDLGNAVITCNDKQGTLINTYQAGQEVQVYLTVDGATAHVRKFGGYITDVNYSDSNRRILQVKCQGYGEMFKKHDVDKIYYGDINLDQSDSTDNLNSSLNFGGANEFVAQSFSPTITENIMGVKLRLRYNTGTGGPITVSLQADTAGSPSGVALATATLPAFTTLTFAWYEFLFTTSVELTKDTTYWLVVSSTTATATNTYILAADTLDKYTRGQLKHSDNAGAAWATTNSEEWWTETQTGTRYIYPSIVVTNDEITHVFGVHTGTNQLYHKYGRFGSWAEEVVDANAINGYTSSAIDSNGIIHVSYMRNTNLYHAYGTTGAWTVELADNGGGANAVGYYSSICIDSNDYIHVAHYDWTAGDLKHSWNSSGAWQSEIVDATANTPTYSSIAVDSKDIFYISYYQNAGGGLYCAIGNSSVFVAGGTGRWTIQSVLAATVIWTTICIDKNDLPHIAYSITGVGSNLYHSSRSVAGAWTWEVIDNTTATGGSDRRICVDSQNNLHIIYEDTTNSNIKYAYKQVGAAWDLNLIDNTGTCSEGGLFIKEDLIHGIWWNSAPQWNTRYSQFFARNTRDAIFEEYCYPPSVSDIFKSLNQEILDLGIGYTFDVETINDVFEITDFQGKGYNIFTANNSLCKDLPIRWWVTHNKVIKLKRNNNLDASTDVIDDGTDGLGAGNTKDLKRDEDKYKLVNVAIVKGKSNQSESTSATYDRKTYANATKTAGTVLSQGDSVDYLNMPAGFLSETGDTVKVLNPDNDFSYAGVIKIDDELIAYEGVSGECLYNCIRGANGTKAQKHFNNSKVTCLEVYANSMVSSASDNFNDNAIAGAWTQHISAASVALGGTLSETNKQFKLDVHARAYGHIQKANTDDLITMITKVKVSDANCGVLGLGLGMYWDNDNNVQAYLWNDGVNYQTRIITFTAGVASATVSANLNANQWYWIKLKANAAGGNFEGYYSLDGVNWILIANKPRSAATMVGAPTVIMVGKGLSWATGGYAGADFNNDYGAIGARSISYMDGFTKFSNSVPSVNVTLGVTVDDTTNFGATGTIKVYDEQIVYSSKAATQFRCDACSIGTKAGTIKGRGNSDGSVVRGILDNARIIDNTYAVKTQATAQANSSISRYGPVGKTFTNLELDDPVACYTYSDLIVDAYDFVSDAGARDPVYTYKAKTNILLMDADVHETVAMTSTRFGLAAASKEITKITYKVNKKGIYCELDLADIVPTFTSMVGSAETQGQAQDNSMPFALGDMINYSDHSDCDADQGLDLEFYIPEGTKQIKNAFLFYTLSRYQAFSTTDTTAWNGGFTATFAGIVNPAIWYPVAPAGAGTLAWGATDTTSAVFSGTYYITNNTITPNKYQVDWRVIDLTTSQVLCQCYTVCNHVAALANADVSSFWMKTYDNLNGRTIAMQVRDNGAGVGGNNITIFWLSNIFSENETTSFDIIYPTTWGVTDVKIIIDGIDKTSDIEADLGHTLEVDQDQGETKIDLTKYIDSLGYHKVTIQPDNVCRIKGDITAILRYSY